MPNKGFFKSIAIISFSFFLSSCFGTSKALKVVDYTDKRVSDLVLTKRVVGQKDFLFFSTTKMALFLEGNIQGIVTDYYGNPIEGVNVKAVIDVQNKENPMGEEEVVNPQEENASSFVNLSFTPGISDSQGLYKVKFSLPVVDDVVDVKGKLIYNPGWEQQKINLGKTYEPQMKQSSFRIYYNLKTGFLAFAEGIRAVIVQPVGEGNGKMKSLPGNKPPETTSPQKTEEKKDKVQQQPTNEDDLFKAFNF
jgi:hypothetical protein